MLIDLQYTGEGVVALPLTTAAYRSFLSLYMILYVRK